MARKLDELIATLPRRERTAIVARAAVLIAEELPLQNREPARADMRRVLREVAAPTGRRPVK
jgi:hypothetical protein